MKNIQWQFVCVLISFILTKYSTWRAWKMLQIGWGHEGFLKTLEFSRFFKIIRKYILSPNVGCKKSNLEITNIPWQYVCVLISFIFKKYITCRAWKMLRSLMQQKQVELSWDGNHIPAIIIHYFTYDFIKGNLI